MSLRTFAPTLAAVIVLGIASQSMAGAITEASGPITVVTKDGARKQVTVEKGKPIALKEGDVVETGGSSATFTSSSGDTIVLEPNTTAKSHGDDGNRDYLFLEAGVGVANLSEKTALGAASGWVTVPAGAKQKAQVFVEVPRDRAAKEALFRTNNGAAWVTYNQFRVWVTDRHAVTLSVNSQRKGVVCYRTHQQNKATVRVEKRVQGGTIITEVPRATSGCSEPKDGDTKTKIDNDITSFKTGKIQVTTDFGEGQGDPAELGPGTYAVVDNATGSITVVFTAVEFEILDQAISLTTEFATLTQSNFSDVK
jgi:hypothetical protein